MNDPVAPPFSSKRNGSKYDFVKVKILLRGHSYILSRFLVQRMLALILVGYRDSLKIALALKKRLVDANRFEVTHEDMEAELFALIEEFGYDDLHIRRYRMMSRFHHQRVPLLVTLSGTGCTSKSTLASQLAERLNLSHSVQTDVIHRLMRLMEAERDGKPVPALEPLWSRDYASPELMLADHRRDSELVRRGVAEDLNNCLKNGKSMIMEGTHVLPSVFFDQTEVREAEAEGSGREGSGAAGVGDPKRKFSITLRDIPIEAQQSAIIVPFLLVLPRSDQRPLLDHWGGCKLSTVSLDKQLDMLEVLQHDLEIQAKGIIKIVVDLSRPEETLNRMHAEVLARIEERDF